MPSEFVSHYLKFNGGYPIKNIFLWNDGGKTAIDTFASLKEDGFFNLEKTYQDLALLEKYLPIGLLPFATDEGGNMFCISTRLDDYGYVYYFNNDQYNSKNAGSALSLLDKSFSHFLESLS